MLKKEDKKKLKIIAQKEKIIKFNIGKNMLEENVFKMLDNALIKYELIKVQFLKSVSDNVTKNELILDIISNLHCEVVQSIGNTVLIYKFSQKAKNHLL